SIRPEQGTRTAEIPSALARSYKGCSRKCGLSMQAKVLSMPNPASAGMRPSTACSAPYTPALEKTCRMCGSACMDELAIERSVSLGHAVQGVVAHDARSRCGAHAFAQIRIAEQCAHGFGHCIGIACRYQYTTVIINQIRIAADMRGDDRQAAGLGLQDRVGKSFRVGGKCEHVQRGQQRIHILPRSEHVHTIFDSPYSRTRLNGAAQWTLAHQQQVHLRICFANPRGSINKVDMPLDREQVRDTANKECVVGYSELRAQTLLLGCAARPEARRINPIRYAQHAIAWCAFGGSDRIEDGRGGRENP